MTRSKGSVFRMKGSANYWVAFYIGGKRTRESSHSPEREVAEELLAKRLLEVAQQLPVEKMVRNTQRDVNSILDDVIADYEANDRAWTDAARRKIDLHLRHWFGHRKAISIDQQDITAFRNHRKKQGAALSEINRELSLLRRAYNLVDLPVKPKIHLPCEYNARQGFFEEKDYLRLLVYLPEDIQSVIKFAYFTGWRINSEILPLEWHMIDWESNCVRLPAALSKNDEPRTFPIVGSVREILEAQREYTDKIQIACARIIPFVFHRRGAAIKSFRASWRKAAVKAGIPNRIPHDLRRTAVRNLVRAGVPESVVMKMTGFKTRSVLDRYDITSERDKFEAMTLLEKKQNINL